MTDTSTASSGVTWYNIAAGILSQVAGALGNTVAGQIFKILSLLLGQWDAIDQGLKSDQPFFDAIKSVIENKGLPPDAFQQITANLQAQDAIIEQEIAADDAAIAAQTSTTPASSTP